MLRIIILVTLIAFPQSQGDLYCSPHKTFYDHYYTVVSTKIEYQDPPYNMTSLGFSLEASKDLARRILDWSLHLAVIFSLPDGGSIRPLAQYYYFVTAINEGKGVENLSNKLCDLVDKTSKVRREPSQEEKIEYLDAHDTYMNFKKDFPAEEERILRYIYDNYHFYHHLAHDLKTAKCLFDPDGCLLEAVRDLKDPL